MAVKRRFGKTGGTVAWHGFQSFVTGEVTPEEAFEIGKETARRIWGDKYQVVVTVHLNTDNLHCHFVVNPISFIDGSRFQNKIYNHRRLREISDEVCRERGKSVLEHSKFYGGKSRGEYWAEKKGNLTHREILKADIEECLKYSDSKKSFIAHLKGMGYTLDEKRMSVKADGWERAVRLKSLGYTTDRINDILDKNKRNIDFCIIVRGHGPYKPKHYPLLKALSRLEYSLSRDYDPAVVLVDTVLNVLICAFSIIKELKDAMFLTPDMRRLERDIKQYVFDYRFLQDNGIQSVSQLDGYIKNTQIKITELERERGLIRNKIRHEGSPEIKAENRKERQKITGHIAPLRKNLKRAKRILEQSPHLYELLRRERTLEIEARERSKEYSR